MTMSVGIIGFPIRHTVSPAFQQAAFDHHRVSARYDVWETPPDDLERRVADLRAGPLLGFNVTVPHKEAVLPLLDDVTGWARTIGAVNTVAVDGQRLVGHNTDADGFLRALRHDGAFEPRGRRVLVLGAGGSARAVCAVLAREGVAAIAVANRTVERAEALAEAARAEGAEARALSLDRDSLAAVLRGPTPPDLIVNCTSLGMRHGPQEALSPLGADLIPTGTLIYDLVYNPPETPLLAAARAAGARTLGGLPMLIYQGAAAFWLWTGMEPPVELMLQTAREALA